MNQVLYFNARSILPKIDSLQAVDTVENTFVVEMWLSGDIDDREVDIPSYDIICKDRNRHEGGVYTCHEPFTSVQSRVGVYFI